MSITASYPNGWEMRQTADIEKILGDGSQRIWVAFDLDVLVGWIRARLHPKNSMGEVCILAVDPDRQREGIGSALLRAALDYLRAADMQIVMVRPETIPVM